MALLQTSDPFSILKSDTIQMKCYTTPDLYVRTLTQVLYNYLKFSASKQKSNPSFSVSSTTSSGVGMLTMQALYQ